MRRAKEAKEGEGPHLLRESRYSDEQPIGRLSLARGATTEKGAFC